MRSFEALTGTMREPLHAWQHMLNLLNEKGDIQGWSTNWCCQQGTSKCQYTANEMRMIVRSAFYCAHYQHSLIVAIFSSRKRSRTEIKFELSKWAGTKVPWEVFQYQRSACGPTCMWLTVAWCLCLTFPFTLCVKNIKRVAGAEIHAVSTEMDIFYF